ncbi:Uncharacterised protein [uncultured Eubacterium sp.]|jgi:putative acyl carrier protein|nr:Uncharacterised protein [uncultured Eubacterium sp.]
MAFLAKVNGTHEYRLMDWTPQSFKSSPTLRLITSDYQSVKNDFTNIKQLEIYSGENLLATYSVFDTMASSASFNSQYYETENRFVDVIEISLIKNNISEQVDKLSKQINKVIDIEEMSVDEYRDYILSQISESAQEDIYAGDVITLSDGTSGKFTYKMEDQANLTSSIAIIDKLMAIQEDSSLIQLPYHSSGQSCQFYSPIDIITIYFTLFMRSVKIQTYTNAINVLIKQAATKEEITKFTYGMELPEEAQENVNNIVATSMAVMQKLMESYQPKESSTNPNAKDNTEEKTSDK